MESKDLEQLAMLLKTQTPKTKKVKTPTIVCNIDGTLMKFADEKALKKFMFKERVDTCIRYNLVGEVTFPVELTVTAIK